MSVAPCSCGTGYVHVVATRHSFEGVGVCLWSDGAITDHLGGSHRTRASPAQPRDTYMAAGWRLMDLVPLYHLHELRDVVQITPPEMDPAPPATPAQGTAPVDERPDFRTLTSGTLLETGSALVYSPDEWHSPIAGFSERPERWTRLTPPEWTTLFERFGATVRLTYRGNFVQLDTLAGEARTDADQ